MRAVALLLAVAGCGIGGDPFTVGGPDVQMPLEVSVDGSAEGKAPDAAEDPFALKPHTERDAMAERDATPASDAIENETLDSGAADVETSPDVDAEPTCDTSTCSCPPVYEAVCCKANGMCGCKVVIGMAGGCT